jgi:hypothetical protein
MDIDAHRIHERLKRLTSGSSLWRGRARGFPWQFVLLQPLHLAAMDPRQKAETADRHPLARKREIPAGDIDVQSLQELGRQRVLNLLTH